MGVFVLRADHLLQFADLAFDERQVSDHAGEPARVEIEASRIGSLDFDLQIRERRTDVALGIAPFDDAVDRRLEHVELLRRLLLNRQTEIGRGVLAGLPRIVVFRIQREQRLDDFVSLRIELGIVRRAGRFGFDDLGFRIELVPVDYGQVGVVILGIHKSPCSPCRAQRTLR